jgi:2-methylcitrate dehydratase PrpD
MASEKQRDASHDFAQMIVKTNYDSLPALAIERVKEDVLDTLGCMVAGSTSVGGPETIALAREWGGAPQAAILAYGDRVPAPVAAFVNGSMGHALDYDDNHDKAIVHVGPATIAPALSLAERVGGLSGKQLIEAVAVGADVIIRLGLATTRPLHESGFMFSPLYGHFGAAAATAKVLGLTETEVINTFGIVYAQAAGNLQVNIDDEHALTKRLQIGFAAKAGVMAGLLAEKGLTGAQNSIEGRFGLFNLYQRGFYDRDRLLDGLGEDFIISELSFKPYSCCRQIHAHVDAALKLRREHHLAPDDIEEVRVFLNADPHFLCDPLGLRRHPQEEVHAQFSLPYSAAAALTHGRLRVKDYTEVGFKDPAVLAMAERVVPVYDETLPTRIIPPSRMEIRTKDGRTVRTEVAEAKGHHTNPMTYDELAEKFRDCVSHSATPIPEVCVERVIDLCADLEDLGDVSTLVDLLIPVRG